jgi:spore maturation protein CgeB
MRIFSAIRHSLDPRYYHGGLWSGNFHPALKRLGHEVVESKVDLKPAWDAAPTSRLQREVRARITEQILQEVAQVHKQQQIDLFLSYFYNAHFDPTGFDDIHRLGIPTVNFYCNSIYQFELVDQIAARVTYAWHAEKHAREKYLTVGANPVWVQMGADPEVYKPIPDAVRLPKACFVGQRYADRDRWLAGLVCAGVPLDIYGSGWGPSRAEHADPMVRRRAFGRARSALSYLRVTGQNLTRHGLIGGVRRTTEQAKFRRESRRASALLAKHAKGLAPSIATTFAEYDVVLNLCNVWADGRSGSALIPHVRLRDFEGPMCATCFLTAQTDEIEEFYKIGVEIDTYGCIDELVEKVRFYLDHPNAAERLRDAGYLRARRDHTWECRFTQLFARIGLS